MYQAILFDLDDTLISLRGCEAQALERTLRTTTLASSLPADFTTVTEAYASIASRYWARINSDDYSRDIVLEHSLRDLLQELNADTVLAVTLADQYWAEFCRSSALNPGAETVLHRLAGNFRLGVITNGYTDSQRGRLAATRLTPLFEVILISEEVGVAKPDARIFQMALSQLKLGRQEVLYVGDSISHDLQGCLNAGIDFCHYCPGASDDNTPRVKFRIRRLEELIDLLR